MEYFWKMYGTSSLANAILEFVKTGVEVNIQKRATLKAEEDLYRAKLGSGKL